MKYFCLVLSALAACVAPSPTTGTDKTPASSTGVGEKLKTPPCGQATGSGTTHSANITANETWTAAESPHVVTSALRVDATLTIEKCATVVLSKGVTLSIGSSSSAGKLITQGAYELDGAGNVTKWEPVLFKNAAAGEFFGAIRVSEKSEAIFNATIVTGGGDNGDYGASVVAVGDNDGSVRASITANLLAVVDSAGFGIALLTGAGFKPVSATNPGLAVVYGTGKKPTTDSAGFAWDYPIFVQPPGIGTIPPGDYRSRVDADYEPLPTLAATDAIFVRPSYAITVDEAFHDRGVPYLMWDSFYMRPTTTAKLAIDPGVTIAFRATDAGTIGMDLGDYSALDDRPVTIDIGDAAGKPVLLTSAATAKAAGDWKGLYLDSSPPSGNSIENTRIEYAGGESGANSFGCGPKDNDAAIMIFNWRPDDAFIRNVTIANSAGGGIMCGWDSDLSGPDLRSGNDFVAIANQCLVSKPRLATAADYCPGRTDQAPLCF